MASGWFVTASDIKNWTETNKRQAEELLPMLVRKLVYASCEPGHIHFPSGDSIAVGGWDGTLEVHKGNEFVPTGKSVWEYGTNKSVKTKADSDYQKRTDNPGLWGTVIQFNFSFGATYDMGCYYAEKSKNRRTRSAASHYLSRH